jgi:hypothetical protein
MTIQELNSRLDNNLRKYIIERDHVITGSLRDSVMFDCKMNGDGFEIEFSSNFYIIFLEEGEFTNDFFELPSTLNIITEFTTDLINSYFD